MRLLSYNIHKGIGGRDRRYDLQRVMDVIEDENPDLICLQEVDRGVRRSRYDDQPELLAWYFRAAGHLYQMNVQLRRGGYGNLLLSRWSFREHHQFSLRLGSKKPRGAQLAVIDTPEGPLALINLHLGLAASERSWQMTRLLGLPLVREMGTVPMMIAGDYNDWGDALGTGALSEGGFVQATSPPSRFRSFPAYLPVGSLDKAFYRGVSIHQTRVVKGARVRSASDHLPLVVDFHLASS